MGAFDTVAVLETNLDDISPEVVGFAIERLFAAGALDVFAVPIQMKKNRPGVLLSVICASENANDLEAILFRETGTFGVRRTTATRAKLQREAVTVETPWGPVKAKRGWRARRRFGTHARIRGLRPRRARTQRPTARRVRGRPAVAAFACFENGRGVGPTMPVSSRLSWASPLLFRRPDRWRQCFARRSSLSLHPLFRTSERRTP